MSKLKQIARLKRIADASYQSSQSAFAREIAEEAKLRAGLAKLSDAMTSAQSDANTAFNAGANAAWQAWVGQRRSSINSELARCLVRLENARSVAAKTFGRCQALSELEAITNSELVLKQNRRALDVLPDDIDDQDVLGHTGDNRLRETR